MARTRFGTGPELIPNQGLTPESVDQDRETPLSDSELCQSPDRPGSSAQKGQSPPIENFYLPLLSCAYSQFFPLKVRFRPSPC
jgi:hypothetical protein